MAQRIFGLVLGYKDLNDHDVAALSLLLQELDPITHELEIDAPFDLEKFLNAGLSKDAHRPEPEREVDCLVRVRIQSVWGYIGYPVFIAMHPSQFQDTKSRDSLIWDLMRDAER